MRESAICNVDVPGMGGNWKREMMDGPEDWALSCHAGEWSAMQTPQSQVQVLGSRPEDWALSCHAGEWSAMQTPQSQVQVLGNWAPS